MQRRVFERESAFVLGKKYNFTINFVIVCKSNVKNKVMGYNHSQDDLAIGNGGAGTAGVWDIFTSTNHDLTGKIVSAFMSLDEDGGTFTAMEEQTTPSGPNRAAVSAAVAANKLAYTYPQYIIFEGRYTTLTPAAGKSFKVWFLK